MPAKFQSLQFITQTNTVDEHRVSSCAWRTLNIKCVMYWLLKYILVMPWLRWLVAGLSLRRPRFVPGTVHVGFVVDRVAVGQVFLWVSVLPSVSFHCGSPYRYITCSADIHLLVCWWKVTNCSHIYTIKCWRWWNHLGYVWSYFFRLLGRGDQLPIFLINHSTAKQTVKSDKFCTNRKCNSISRMFSWFFGMHWVSIETAM
jgi:hypothetical protein